MKQINGEVWRWNKEVEMNAISKCLRDNRFIAIDTEFPGCLNETPMDASEEDRHTDMKFNVDKTKLIQLGLTLFDEDGVIGGTWEINFSDFVESKDAKNEKSIHFLRRNGLNLEKIREEGICIYDFFKEFTQILKENEEELTWVTFHGSYDMAYLVKGFTGGQPLPETPEGFQEEVERLFGFVYDVKEMAKLCYGLSSRYGLQRVADAFHITRAGKAHHAGSDSQLTALVFTKMSPLLSQEHETRRLTRRAHQLYLHDQDQLMMTRCYVPQHPQRSTRPMIFSAYPSFGGYFVVPVQGSNYVSSPLV